MHISRYVPLTILLAVLLTLLLSSSGGEPADSSRAGPTGYYEGTAKSKQAGALDVSLNLRGVKGQYEGELTTPMGEFALKAGAFEAGRLRVHFDAGGERGTIDARLVSSGLHGAFRVGNDTGAVQLRRVGEPRPLSPSAPRLDLGKEQRREDLHYFARELPRRHGNAFHHVSRARFEAAVTKLDRRIDHLGGDAFYVGLNQIATLVGDGHTYVEFPPDRATLPLTFERFKDEYRVIRVTAGLEKALGARVVKVHDTPIARVREILLSMTPGGETPELAEARVTYFLSLGMVLHGFEIIPERKSARLTLAGDEGHEYAVTDHALRPGEKREWISVCKAPPLYQQRPGESFWYTHLPDARTVYCNFRGYQELGKHARGLLALVNEKRPDKLVIDLRQNGGGDFTEGLKHLIDPIRKLPSINAKGHLFVLIGVHTFSAAMSNAAQFRSRTSAMLVGQTIGERPNSYQEVRQMRLPNSRLEVRYSTRYYRFVETGENVIRPDREIIPSWAEYKAGRDPVLEWVLKHEVK
jgi:hypothetical protein